MTINSSEYQSKRLRTDYQKTRSFEHVDGNWPSLVYIEGIQLWTLSILTRVNSTSHRGNQIQNVFLLFNSKQLLTEQMQGPR